MREDETESLLAVTDERKTVGEDKVHERNAKHLRIGAWTARDRDNRKISGGDALRGDTRSHPEHDG